MRKYNLSENKSIFKSVFCCPIMFLNGDKTEVAECLWFGTSDESRKLKKSLSSRYMGPDLTSVFSFCGDKYNISLTNITVPDQLKLADLSTVPTGLGEFFFLALYLVRQEK